jgi:translation initiation factor 1
MSKEKISTDGGQWLGQNPFAALSGVGLPQKETGISETGNRKPETGVVETGNRKPETGKRVPPPGTETRKTGSIRNPQSEIRNQKNRGRLDIRRETGGRGGKTVTLIDGFVGIGLPEKEQLAKKIRGACGCGGTVKDGAIEIQGDQRDTIARILTEAGFRPVFAGG